MRQTSSFLRMGSSFEAVRSLPEGEGEGEREGEGDNY